MYPDSRFGYWSNQHLKSSAESNWKIKEFLAPMTTRWGRTVSVPIQPRSKEEYPPSDTNKDTTAMAALHEEDPEIGSLNAHLNGEPSSAIIISTGQAGTEVKNNLLAVMPHFYGRRIDNPYEFLHEFYKLCDIQRRPAGSTEEDYRLQYFFSATRTNALKKEIQGATQEDDETLSQYWGRFKRMLDACPNNKMSEAEIYNNFYEGMTPECKDLVNSASGGDFSRLRVSEIKRILSRLIDAKKAYDSPRTTLLRRGTVNAASKQPEDRMEAMMDKLEKAIISALEKTKQPTPTEKCPAPLGQEESYQYYNSLAEAEYPAQPRKRKISRIEERDRPVGQAEILKEHTNWAIEVQMEMQTGPVAISPTGPADISRDILLIHIHLLTRKDFQEAERASHRKGQRHKKDTTKALDQAGIATPKGKGTIIIRISKEIPTSTKVMVTINLHHDPVSLSKDRSRNMLITVLGTY
ncbi:hypothetical protein AAHA92_21673 [Salvia divinorum]|uniref:Retrotransposon gag domain-containing protein n=1 Tax=Salvia divinorum TaxID=28513 RepID=A0ABD1GP62_SALDI